MEQDVNISTFKFWIIEQLKELLDIPEDIEIEEDKKFSLYGLTSLKATELSSRISERFKIKFSPTIFFAFPTLKELLNNITLGNKGSKAVFKKRKKSDENEPIAVIGMSCRFPQAENLKGYWNLLKNGVNAITEVPSERWNAADYYDPDPNTPGKTNTKYGAFLNDIDNFDPFFFDISPREALEMSPSQKLMLEIVWEALEHAEIPYRELEGSLTGVFVGSCWNDFEKERVKHKVAITQHSAIGQSSNIIANRVSYAFGFRGPSMVIDTACSSSLVAVHMACQSLREGDSNIAIAGGVNVMTDPETFVALSKFGGLCADGQCKTFDEKANGYVRGEGVGVVVLKRLSQAIEDNDEIHAVIKGSAVNNDGYSNGLSAPNMEAQKEVLRLAYDRAGIQPKDVHYVECHGTGTKLGDPIEAEALGSVLGEGRKENKELVIGSLKTNIGHLEGAAGIAGLIKILLSIKHKKIPKSINFDTPNPYIPFDDLNLKVQTENTAWPTSKYKNFIAGISSFGWGGTNCHLVVEQYPYDSDEIFAISENTAKDVFYGLNQVKEYIRTYGHEIVLKKLCGEFANINTNKKHRIAFKVSSIKELENRLNENLLDSGISKYYSTLEDGKALKKTAFICSPFGAGYTGMAIKLFEKEKIFRKKFEHCDALFRQIAPWSLVQHLYDEDISIVENFDTGVPLLFAIQVSLYHQLKHWGIHPDIVTGHSMGEIAAAHISGFLSLEDAVTIAFNYGKYGHKLAGTGGMILIQAKEEQVAPRLADYPLLEIAGNASPVSTIVSGDNLQLEKFKKMVTNSGWKAMRVNVKLPCHSSSVSLIADELTKSLDDIRPMDPILPMISTVTGKIVNREQMTPYYWASNLRDKILFSQVSGKLIDEGYDVFIELGPHPVLRQSMRETIIDKKARNKTILYTLERDKPDDVSSYNMLFMMYHLGYNIQWKNIYSKFQNTEKLIDGTEQKVEEELLVLPISAKSEYSLKTYAEEYKKFLKDHTKNTVKAFHKVCATAATRRSHFALRLAFIGRNKQELIDKIDVYLNDKNSKVTSNKLKGGKKLAFVFPGQGAQWIGMGRDLMEKEEVFREAIEECDRVFTKHVDWSLIEILTSEKQKDRFNEINVIQPVIFAVQVALAKLWISWGVKPDSVVGHSLGEVAAAQIAGVLNLNDAARIICTRSRLMRLLSGKGAMAVTELTVPEAEEMIAKYPGSLSVAVSNSPRSTVISGDSIVIDDVLSQLEKEGVFCRKIKVDVASHSYQMDEIKGDLKNGIDGIKPRFGTIPIYSTVRNKIIGDKEMDEEYWVENLRNPVMFSDAIDQLVEDEHTLYIEVSPHPVLATPIRECLDHHKLKNAVVIPSLKRNESEQEEMIKNLSELYVNGFTPNWNTFYQDPASFVELPRYPWYRKLYKIEKQTDELEETFSTIRSNGVKGHPLLGRFIQLAVVDDLYFWEVKLNTQRFPFLSDHQVSNTVIFPGTGYMEMALAAVKEVLGKNGQFLENIQFHKALIIPDKKAVTLQLKIKLNRGDQKGEFQFFSTDKSKANQPNPWTLVTEGLINLNKEIDTYQDFTESSNYQQYFPITQTETQDTTVSFSDNSLFYNRLNKKGFHYGEYFQGVEKLWLKDNQAFIQFSPDKRIKNALEEYIVHPALMDICVQTIFGTILNDNRSESFLPTSVGGLEFVKKPEYEEELWGHVEYLSDKEESRQKIRANLTLFEKSGDVVLRMNELCVTNVEQTDIQLEENYFEKQRYQVNWIEKSLPEVEVDKDNGTYILFADQNGYSDQLAYKLEKKGYNCIMINEGFSYRKLSGNAKKYFLNPVQADGYKALIQDLSTDENINLKGIVHLWSINSVFTKNTSADYLEMSQDTGSLSVIYLIQALATIQLNTYPKLTIVTDTSQPIHLMDNGFNISQTLLWGINKVANTEHGEFDCKIIDIHSPENENESNSLVNEIITPEKGEQQVVLRGEQRFVPRLEHYKEVSKNNISVSAQGTYLITGGYGGFGFAFAEWLVSWGAKHLVLVGRRGRPESMNEAVESLKNKGVNILELKADISSEEDAKHLISITDEKMPPLTGVFHTAGILDDSSLVNLTQDQLYKVMGPKVKGAWNLHQNTLKHELDCFVVFSSATVLLGNAGQANYVASNAFLDSLAHYRKSLGLSALSINWGVTLTSMVSQDENRAQRLAEEGFKSFTLKESLDLFETIFVKDVTQVGLMDVDFEKWRKVYPTIEKDNYYSALLATKNHNNSEVQPVLSGILQQLKNAENEEQQLDVLEGYFKENVGEIIKASADQVAIDSEFKNMGMDSLMTIQLRNKLEQDFETKIAVTSFWANPTIKEYSAYLLNEIDLDSYIVDEVNAEISELNGVLGELAQAGNEENRIDILEQFLQKETAEIIKATADQIDVNIEFKNLGMDSLMTIQLRNKLEATFETKLPVTTFWANPTVKAYAEYLVGVLEIEGNAVENFVVEEGKASTGEETRKVEQKNGYSLDKEDVNNAIAAEPEVGYGLNHNDIIEQQIVKMSDDEAENELDKELASIFGD